MQSARRGTERLPRKGKASLGVWPCPWLGAAPLGTYVAGVSCSSSVGVLPTGWAPGVA